MKFFISDKPSIEITLDDLYSLLMEDAYFTDEAEDVVSSIINGLRNNSINHLPTPPKKPSINHLIINDEDI